MCEIKFIFTQYYSSAKICSHSCFFFEPIQRKQHEAYKNFFHYQFPMQPLEVHLFCCNWTICRRTGSSSASREAPACTYACLHGNSTIKSHYVSWLSAKFPPQLLDCMKSPLKRADRLLPDKFNALTFNNHSTNAPLSFNPRWVNSVPVPSSLQRVSPSSICWLLT